MKKKVLLSSPLLTTSGYGVNGRTVLRALRKYEDYFDIYIRALNWGHCSWLVEDNEERHYIDSLIMKTTQYIQASNGNPQFDIFCSLTIPNEWEQKAPINIGITAGIESTKIAPQWVEKSQLMNKIIVVSNHAKYGFDNSAYDGKDPNTGQIVKGFKCQSPVEVINYPVRKVPDDKIVPVDLNLESDFNYLLVAQWSARKNVEKVLTWFVEENLEREDIGLVCKLNTAANSQVDKEFTEKRIKALLQKFPNRKCKIYFVHGDATEEEMASVYTNPKVKAAISLSPEGYGLFPFEAAYYGLPVITIPWGGPCDFMYLPVKNKKGKEVNKPMFCEVEYELKPIPPECVWEGVLVADSQWAYPKEGSFKVKMREIRAKYPEYKEMALMLQKHLLENFTEEKIYHQYAEAILGQKIVKVDTSTLPKVSIVTSVYGVPEFLEKCFEDVEQQTMFKEKCEHIIVHPKTSPDFEEEKRIILEYQKRNGDKVKYIELEEDPGLYGCWNVGIECSTGEYITNWNTDDRRSHDCIERCSKELFLEEDVDVIYYDQFITDKPNETFLSNSSQGKKYNFPSFSFDYLKMLNLFHAMTVWKKDMHKKCGMFDTVFKSAGDWSFALRAAYLGSKFKKLTDVLGLYYFNPTGISTNVENFSWKKKEEEKIYEFFKDLQVGDGKFTAQEIMQEMSKE